VNRQTKLALAVAGPTAFVGWMSYQYVTEIAAPPVEPPPVVVVPVPPVPPVDPGTPPVVVPVDPLQARIDEILAAAAVYDAAMVAMVAAMDGFNQHADAFRADGYVVEYEWSPGVHVERIYRVGPIDVVYQAPQP
jgi:hypothetical protein